MTRLAIALAAVAVALTGCGGDDGSGSSRPSRTPQAAPTLPTNAPSMDAADKACEKWQTAGGKGSRQIHTPQGDTTCVGAS